MTESRDRNRVIEELIAVGRDAVARGLVLASGGNLSARLSEGTFVLTASGTWLDRLTPADFVTLTLAEGAAGTPQSSPEIRPSSEWKLHHRAYLARPDIECVIHLHPRHAVVLASLGREIRLLTLDHAFYVGSIGITPFYHNGSDELADTAAEQLQTHNCVVMQHHGCSVVGDSVGTTYRRALNLEDAAKATALALQLGDVNTAFPTQSFAELHHN